MSSKLRASCDACHKAKVKCTAGVIECLRCRMMGKKCQYSPALPRLSQRKRLNSSNGSDSGSSPAADPSVNQDNLTTVLLSAPSHTESLELLTDDIMELIYPSSLDLDLADLQWNNYGSQEDLTNRPLVSEAPNQRCDAVLSPLPIHLSAVSVPSRRDPSVDCDEGCSNPSNDLGSPHPNQRSQRRLQMGAVKGSSNHPISCGKQVGTEHNQNDPEGDHATCLSKLLAAIQNVHMSLTAPIDVVLKVNRDAVTCCLSAMRCSCTRRFNVLIISCGVLELVLNLYQSAVENFCDGGGTGSGGSAVENLHGSTPNPPPVQLKLGGLDIEKEDQEHFVRELVTRAICKIDETVLPAFRSAVGTEAQDLAEALVLHLSRKSKLIVGKY